MEKQKEKDETHKGITEKTKHNRASKLLFFPSPTPFEKYKPTFSQNFSTFRDFFPCFISNLPTPHKIPFTLRAGHAPTRIYARALSANFLFLPSPFTSPHNKLYISRLRVKAKGWKLHPQLTIAQDFTPKRWRGEGKNIKSLDARACIRVQYRQVANGCLSGSWLRCPSN